MSFCFSSFSSTQYSLGMTKLDVIRHSGQDLETMNRLQWEPPPGPLRTHLVCRLRPQQLASTGAFQRGVPQSHLTLSLEGRQTTSYINSMASQFKKQKQKQNLRVKKKPKTKNQQNQKKTFHTDSFRLNKFISCNFALFGLCGFCSVMRTVFKGWWIIG